MKEKFDRLLGNGLIKAAAIALFILSAITFAISTAAIVVISEVGGYNKTADYVRERKAYYSSYAHRYADGIVQVYAEEHDVYEEDVELISSRSFYNEARNGDGMNFDYEIYASGGSDPISATSPTRVERVNGNYCYGEQFRVSYVYGRRAFQDMTVLHRDGDNYYDLIPDVADEYRVVRTYYDADSKTYYTDLTLYEHLSLSYDVVINLYSDPLITDDYSMMHFLLETGYNQRYTAIVLCVLSFIFTVILFICLIFAAGHRRNREGIVRTPFDRIPCDLFTLLIGGAVTGLVFLLVRMVKCTIERTVSVAVSILVSSAAAILSLLLLTFWFMSISTRVKCGKWWRNTLICLLFCRIAFLIRSLPVIWKSLLFLLFVGYLNLLAFLFLIGWGSSFGVLFWILDWLLIAAVVIGCTLSFKRLSKGAKRIAEGEPDAKVNTDHLVLEFRKLGENLNHISEGIRRAVDEQMKSERMKTELITNVSHDIKTPLTSIINYVDLLEREGAVTEAGTEYLDVLSRQSARLKKLIEDLIQASKASTGNLETHMIETDSVVLAQQIVGEYGDRLQEAGLEMICHVETESASILADGQLLYRVFDNLLSNICKYAQPGTRVYLDVTETAGDLAGENARKIRYVFRNISASPLHISPDELTERFVRGDSSRNTEGSGLGLSIAKSLTELQGGSFALEIDGDLFKAILEFDRIE